MLCDYGGFVYFCGELFFCGFTKIDMFIDTGTCGFYILLITLHSIFALSVSIKFVDIYRITAVLKADRRYN